MPAHLDHDAWVKHQRHVHEHRVVLGDGKVVEPARAAAHHVRQSPPLAIQPWLHAAAANTACTGKVCCRKLREL